MIDLYNTFLINDQPMTCPKCGTRTDFFVQISPVSNEYAEIHKCLSKECQFEFVAECDENFENEEEE
jgi:hypothetical protein